MRILWKLERAVILFNYGLGLFALTMVIFGAQQPTLKAITSEDRQKILTEQEHRAQQYVDDPKVMKSVSDRFPPRSKRVLELLGKGTWLCDNNGGSESDDGAPTEELRAVAYDRGIDYIKQAIEEDPKFPALYLAMGEFLRTKAINLSNTGHFVESKLIMGDALQSYQKARELDPSNPAVYFGIALTSSSSDRDEAIRNLLIVERLDPQHPSVHGILAGLYELKGDFGRAMEECLKSFDDPGEPSEKIDELERMTGQSKQYGLLLKGYLEFLDRDPKARSFDRVLFAISPFRPKKVSEIESMNLQSVIDHKELADFLVKVGSKAIQKEEANAASAEEQAYKKMIERDPSKAVKRENLIGFAEKSFRKALELDPARGTDIIRVTKSSQFEELQKFSRELPR